MVQHKQSHLWTTQFIALTVSSLLLFLNLQMLLAAFPAYAKSEFQADDVMVSLLTSVFAIAAILARFMTAYLLRRFSRNLLLFSGLATAILLTAGYVLAHSIQSLLVMRIIYGIGFGMASTIIPTVVSQIIPPGRMGEGIGYFGLSTSIALALGPLIGLNVLQHYNFGTLTVIGTITGLLIFPILLVSRSLPPAPIKQETVGKQQKTSASFNPKLLFPALLNILLAVTYSGLLSFIALYGEALQLKQVGLFFLFNVITVILIRPISGRLFDSKGHAAVLIPAAVCVIVSLTLLSYTTTMPLLIISALLYGVGFGAIQPTIQAWMLRSGPKEQYGIANSMFYNSTEVGIAAGSLLLGFIANGSSYAVMYRFSAGFMVLFLIMYAVVAVVQRKKRQPAAELQKAEQKVMG